MQGGPLILPELRPELRLVPGAPAATGEPSWLIHDPVQNKFIQIDRVAYEVLSRWEANQTATELVQQINQAGRMDVDLGMVEALTGFLYQSRLTVEPARDGWRHFESERLRSRKSIGSWLLHNYLFFRIPLVQPQKFLERTLPLADALSSRTSNLLILALGLTGLYLAMRQWEAFVATIPDLFSFEGAVSMALTLLVIKAAHELGHAYTAVRLGCRVPTMGVAMMMMAPLLYTDVTDAWRLTDRRQRFRIDSAGIRVELAIASVALFVWSFLPDGALRGLAFSLCAVSLISSLAINLNPLMRFDGYYLLSEMLSIENLQGRSFDLGCWKLREWLFGFGEPCPEDLPRARVNFLVGYAWAVWIYRLFLFIGIALIVYHYFFKLLGVILFAVEIAVFVARPVWNEIKVWYGMKDRIAKNRRSWVTGLAAASLILLAVVPWSTRVSIPAIVEMASLQPVYAPRGALIEAVHVEPGQHVVKGAPIITMASPDLLHELDVNRTSLRLARVQYARRGADAGDKEVSLVTENRIAALESKIRGLEKELAELVVTAPLTGTVLELNKLLHPGRWLGPKEAIALIGSDDGYIVKGYVSEDDLWRLAAGASGEFVPEALSRAAVPVSIDEIAVGNSDALELLDLASTHAGRIPVTTDRHSRNIPMQAQYRVTMQVPQAASMELSVRGVALIHGKAESLASRFWRQALKVFMRESGA